MLSVFICMNLSVPETVFRQDVIDLEHAPQGGILAKTFHTRQPQLIDRPASQDSETVGAWAGQVFRPTICVPIIFEGESLGVLCIDNLHSQKSLTQSDVSLLAGIAQQIGISIHNARSFQRLQASEEKYRDLVENANSIILRVDRFGKIIFFNEFAQRFFGYREAEIVGRKVVGTIVAKDSSEKRFFARIMREMEHDPQRYANLTSQNVKKDGHKVWISWTSKPKYDQKGQFTEILWIGNDITAQKHAEMEKKELELQLQRAQKMEAIGTLAGGVAHDLNNILTGIVSYPDLLLLKLPDESPLRKPLMTMKNSGERAAAIVQDLLTLARRGVKISQVVSMNEIVVEYFNSPEHEYLTRHHPHVQFEVSIDPELLNIMGSRVHLSKTVMNLVSNATEAMPEGGKVVITTHNCYISKPIKGYDSVREGEYVLLTIEDTGVGIAPKDLPRIFEPFYSKKVMGRSGTGLGMAVVWGTVKDHDGYIDLHSTEGQGTRFDIYIPVTRTAMEQRKPGLILEDLKGTESILVVDDMEEQREIATKLLSMLNYQVSAVESGVQALEYLARQTCDLVILDMIMEPGMDGLDTYIKILEIAPHQKALIVSGYSETDRVREALSLGAGAYVKKPYLLETMGSAVRKVLDG